MRRRDFPKSLEINGNEWQILFRKLIEGDPYCYGLCCFDTRTITIRTGLKPDERRKTFFHELLHAIDYEYNINIAHRLVYKLEGPLSDVFEQNCWLEWYKLS